jgi:BirA family biotin operon repressor/biotin-[acetyl-CoA-carboxylase] ligase
MNWNITRFPLLASTNDLALEWMRADQARAGDVLVTAEQLAGRGRPGRSWHSPRGALLMTALLPFSPERVGWTALAAGIAVASAVRELGAPARVKWPNDVVLDGRKLAGILVETSLPGLVAVGIGMNVTNPLPPDPDLAARTARLADFLTGADVEGVLEQVLEQLARTWLLLAAADLSPLQSAWTALDTTRGRRVQWSAAGVCGTAEGVDETGALLLRTDDSRLVTAAVGEVTFL